MAATPAENSKITPTPIVETLWLLFRTMIKNGHDIKWLMRTINPPMSIAQTVWLKLAKEGWVRSHWIKRIQLGLIKSGYYSTKSAQKQKLPNHRELLVWSEY